MTRIYKKIALASDFSIHKEVAFLPFDSSNIETRLQPIGSFQLVVDVIKDMDAAHQFLLSRRKFELKNWAENDIFPHFGVIWPSALALAGEVANSPYSSMENSMHCLELGCGLALPSVILKKRWPHLDIMATDRHPWVPIFLQRNVKRNKIQLKYENLEWRALRREQSRYVWLRPMNYGLILGSDLLYYPWQPAALAHTIKLLLEPTKGHAMIADPGRRFLDEFNTQIKLSGLKIFKEQVIPVNWGHSTVKVTILHIKCA